MYMYMYMYVHVYILIFCGVSYLIVKAHNIEKTDYVWMYNLLENF